MISLNTNVNGIASFTTFKNECQPDTKWLRRQDEVSQVALQALQEVVIEHASKTIEQICDFLSLHPQFTQIRADSHADASKLMQLAASCPKLEQLALGVNHLITVDDVRVLIQSLPHLRTLVLEPAQQITQDQIDQLAMEFSHIKF